MQSRAEANQRNEILLKQNQDLMMQMKQMRHEIDDLKLSTLSKVSDQVLGVCCLRLGPRFLENNLVVLH